MSVTIETYLQTAKAEGQSAIQVIKVLMTTHDLSHQEAKERLINHPDWRDEARRHAGLADQLDQIPDED